MQFQQQPQEIEVWYVIPAIRSEIAKELKVFGLSGVKIAQILGITNAAVSQYLNKKRAKDVIFPENIKSMIKDELPGLQKNPEVLRAIIQKITKEIRNTGLLCEYHKRYCDIGEKCAVCIE